MPLLNSGDIPKDVIGGIGITLFVLVVATVLPIIGMAGILVLPLLALYYRARLGRKKGGLVPAVAFVIMAVLLGRASVDLLVILSLFLLGNLLGEAFEKDQPLEKAVGIACGGVVLAVGMLLFCYSIIVNTSITELISTFVNHNLALYQSGYEALEISDEKRQVFAELMAHLSGLLVRILPGLFIAGLLFSAWITMMLARPVFFRAGLAFPPFEVMNRWQAPDPLVWGVIGFGVMLLIPSPGIRAVGQNGVIVMMQIYFFQGIGIVSFFFDKKKLPLLIRGALYTLILLQVYLLLLVIGLGFFDMWLNIRRLNANENS